MDFRVGLQLAEAFGPMNRWFCAEFYGREITDRELLLRYYIRSGGAKDFAERYTEAIGPVNRWYCSEYHRRDVRDAESLWEYYVQDDTDAASRKSPPLAHVQASVTSQTP